MSVTDQFKESKKLIVILAAAGIVIAALIVIVPHFLMKEPETGPEVIAKKVKIDLKEKPAAPPAEAKPAEAKPAAPAPPATQAPAAIAKAPAAQAPETKKPGPAAPAARVAEAQKPAVKGKPAEPVKTEARKAEKPEAHAKRTKAATSKPWAINLSSFITDRDAQSLKKSLKAAGFNAYVAKYPSKDNITWYRVRVGFYRTEKDARKAGKTIVQRFKIQHDPWVLKPSRQEAAKYAK